MAERLGFYLSPISGTWYFTSTSLWSLFGCAEVAFNFEYTFD